MNAARLRAVAGDSLPVVMLCLVALFVALDAINFSLFALGDDWGPLWVAGHLAWTNPVKAYDFHLVSSLQRPLVGAIAERPFVYPPSALLLFSPLALLPFLVSFGLFMLASLMAFERASSRIGAQVLLLFLAPAVVLAAMAGQPTLLVSALILFALLRLDENELHAGVLFGVAAMIKPPLLLLAPIALAGGGYWRALAASAATALGIGIASLAAFGVDSWVAWLSALPRFDAVVTGFEPLLRNALTPHAMAVRLGLPAAGASFFAAVVAIPVAWLTFARVKDVRIRLVALVGGALLISPYAMNYELAGLAPAVAAMSFRRARDGIVPAIWAGSLFVNVSILGLLAVYGWALFRLAPCLRSAADDLPVQRRFDVPA